METITCKYCNEAENKQTRPGLICATCTRFVHLACLRSQGTPGNFAADVFFDFMCEDCSPNKAELFVRPKMPWVNVLVLTLNHLSVNVQYNSNHGFYHYKTQICTFIDSNFVSLFGATSSKKKNLLGTVAGVLSKYSNTFFRSGSITLGEPGWWQLMHRFSPAVAAHINQEMTRSQLLELSLDMTAFFSIVSLLGYKHYITYVAEIPVNLIAKGGGAKKRPHPNSSAYKASFSAAPILLDPEKPVPSVSFSSNVSRSLPCGMEWEPQVEQPLLAEQATSSVSYLATGDHNYVRSTSSGFTFAASAVQPIPVNLIAKGGGAKKRPHPNSSAYKASFSAAPILLDPEKPVPSVSFSSNVSRSLPCGMEWKPQVEQPLLAEQATSSVSYLATGDHNYVRSTSSGFTFAASAVQPIPVNLIAKGGGAKKRPHPNSSAYKASFSAAPILLDPEKPVPSVSFSSNVSRSLPCGMEWKPQVEQPLLAEQATSSVSYLATGDHNYVRSTSSGFTFAASAVQPIPVNLIAKGGGAKKRPHPNSSAYKASFSAAPILLDPEKPVPSVSFSSNFSRSLPCGMEWEPQVEPPLLAEQATSSVSYLATGDHNYVRSTSSGFTFAASAVQPIPVNLIAKGGGAKKRPHPNSSAYKASFSAAPILLDPEKPVPYVSFSSNVSRSLPCGMEWEPQVEQPLLAEQATSSVSYLATGDHNYVRSTSSGFTFAASAVQLIPVNLIAKGGGAKKRPHPNSSAYKASFSAAPILLDPEKPVPSVSFSSNVSRSLPCGMEWEPQVEQPLLAEQATSSVSYLATGDHNYVRSTSSGFTFAASAVQLIPVNLIAKGGGAKKRPHPNSSAYKASFSAAPILLDPEKPVPSVSFSSNVSRSLPCGMEWKPQVEQPLLAEQATSSVSYLATGDHNYVRSTSSGFTFAASAVQPIPVNLIAKGGGAKKRPHPNSSAYKASFSAAPILLDPEKPVPSVSFSSNVSRSLPCGMEWKPQVEQPLLAEQATSSVSYLATGDHNYVRSTSSGFTFAASAVQPIPVNLIAKGGGAKKRPHPNSSAYKASFSAAPILLDPEKPVPSVSFSSNVSRSLPCGMEWKPQVEQPLLAEQATSSVSYLATGDHNYVRSTSSGFTFAASAVQPIPVNLIAKGGGAKKRPHPNSSAYKASFSAAPILLDPEKPVPSVSFSSNVSRSLPCGMEWKPQVEQPLLAEQATSSVSYLATGDHNYVRSTSSGFTFAASAVQPIPVNLIAKGGGAKKRPHPNSSAYKASFSAAPILLDPEKPVPSVSFSSNVSRSLPCGMEWKPQVEQPLLAEQATSSVSYLATGDHNYVRSTSSGFTFAASAVQPIPVNLIAKGGGAKKRPHPNSSAYKASFSAAPILLDPEKPVPSVSFSSNVSRSLPCGMEWKPQVEQPLLAEQATSSVSYLATGDHNYVRSTSSGFTFAASAVQPIPVNLIAKGGGAKKRPHPNSSAYKASFSAAPILLDPEKPVPSVSFSSNVSRSLPCGMKWKPQVEQPLLAEQATSSVSYLATGDHNYVRSTSSGFTFAASAVQPIPVNLIAKGGGAKKRPHPNSSAYKASFSAAPILLDPEKPVPSVSFSSNVSRSLPCGMEWKPQVEQPLLAEQATSSVSYLATGDHNYVRSTSSGFTFAASAVQPIPVNLIAKGGGAKKRPHPNSSAYKASFSAAPILLDPEKPVPSVSFSSNVSRSLPCGMEWKPQVEQPLLAEQATSSVSYLATGDHNYVRSTSSGFTFAASAVQPIPVNLIAKGGGAKKRPHPNSSAYKASFSAAPILLDPEKPVPSVSFSSNVSRSLPCGMEWKPQVEQPLLAEQATSSVSYLATGDHNYVRSTSSGFTFAASAVQPSKNEGRVDRAKKRYEPGFPTHSLLSSASNTTRMPLPDDAEKPKERGHIVELTPYEEMELLENIRNRKVKKPNKVELHRQRAILAQRKLERDCNLITLFDLVEPSKIHGNVNPRRDFTKAGGVLERFQNMFMINRSGTIARAFCGTLLLPDIKPTTIRSEYSGKTLKPFIRRDSTSTSPWLKLMDELLRVTHRDIKDYSPPPRHTIDYSFVRPQHIAAINKMCEQFFWPGIDLSEALEYPEYSCVVTYKRVVVAFAFLVPESCRNEGYIPFVLTRPEWRRAHIATKMLRHLLQVCRDQDVTLHCSPANPAIFLYQKFGFKAEEMIQKVVHMDLNKRDALYMRLLRQKTTYYY